MNSEPKLETALVWDQGGHLADTAVTALVDGELGLLPEEAVGHADGCLLCAERIGRATMLALEICDSLDAYRRRAAPARALAGSIPSPRPFPVAAFAFALALAFIGALPTLRVLPEILGRLPALVRHVLPVYARAATLAVSGARSGGLLVAAWLATAALLVVTGIVIARLAPRQSHWKEAS